MSNVDLNYLYRMLKKFITTDINIVLFFVVIVLYIWIFTGHCWFHQSIMAPLCCKEHLFHTCMWCHNANTKKKPKPPGLCIMAVHSCVSQSAFLCPPYMAVLTVCTFYVLYLFKIFRIFFSWKVQKSVKFSIRVSDMVKVLTEGLFKVNWVEIGCIFLGDVWGNQQFEFWCNH